MKASAVLAFIVVRLGRTLSRWECRLPADKHKHTDQECGRTSNLDKISAKKLERVPV